MALSPEAIRRGDIPGVQLRCRACVPGTPAETWARLTEPAGLESWLASRLETSPIAGVEMALLVEADERPATVEIRSLESVPGARWVVAWQERDAGWPVATRLTLSVGGDGRDPASPPICRPSETAVSVFQQGFEHLPLSDCLTIWERYRRFWRTALGRLATSGSSSG